MSVCICGHDETDHIYHEGACRPGFVCEEECERYERYVPSVEVKVDHFPYRYDSRWPIETITVLTDEGFKTELYQCETCMALVVDWRGHSRWHEGKA